VPEVPMRIGIPMMVVSLLLPLAAAAQPSIGVTHPDASPGPPSVSRRIRQTMSAAKAGAVPQGQVFRSSAPTVAVYVTVTDQAGIQGPNLTRDDFEIYDNGKRQTITVFESAVQPITIVLIRARSGSMMGNFNLVRSAAEQFVSKLLPADKARIGSFANRIQLDPREFTS